MENENGNGAAAEPEVFPLDEALIEMIAEIRLSQQQAQQQLSGALNHFLRQHKMQGVWNVAENGRELVKQATPAPAGR